MKLLRLKVKTSSVVKEVASKWNSSLLVLLMLRWFAVVELVFYGLGFSRWPIPCGRNPGLVSLIGCLFWVSMPHKEVSWLFDLSNGLLLNATEEYHEIVA
ncbi:hypothetical protein Tco_0894249 [Tanacetum coccineum]|uniref:Uncharacterized protein n=1 Tax=Tanacetum coccineum TaxID=301880 RepID=A0ABQ5CDR4_9ASTR